MNNHRRYNPLLDEWVIVAANRVSRPWSGKKGEEGGGFEKEKGVNPLAPGGERSNGKVTPNYSTTFVFDNDFPTFTDDGKTKSEVRKDDGKSNDSFNFFKDEEVRGVCRVICYSPDTKQCMATMSIPDIRKVIDIWLDQFNELKNRYTWVQIFENRGAAVGCSNAHPHGQLWAGDFLPNLPKRKDETQRAYKKKNGGVMLFDYLHQEKQKKERVVVENQHWTWLVPYWAVWPYETMLIPNRHVQRLDQLTEEEKVSLTSIMKELLTRYDNIFECPFAFGMGWLGAPTGPYLQEDCSHWQLHAIFHPPLLRSATVQKFMAGYEILAEPQRDITAEMAAETIRKQPTVHYTEKLQQRLHTSFNNGHCN